MNDDTASDIDTTDDEPADGGILDEYDDAVIAADDTGMLAGERLIVQAELEEGLEGK